MKIASSFSYELLLMFICLFLLYPALVTSDCTGDDPEPTYQKRSPEALKYKLASIPSLLLAGGLGVCLPLLGRKIRALRPENDMFFMVKAFAAGVILATGFIHILPDAFRTLNPPCLKDNLWRDFPFPGFVAMMSAIGTLMIETMASGYYKRRHFSTPKRVVSDEERGEEDHTGHVHVHTHASHGHAHGSTSPSEELTLSELLRRRIVSQVLELGIVVHSVIIGMSLGASRTIETIKPLLAALCFHQFFEGLGLGGCISQAEFRTRSTVIMAFLFSLTTPAGVALGIGISNHYDDNSSTALIVEGIIESASAGILIYMALVDLLADDFMNPRLLRNIRLQLGANVSLLLGAGCMSVMAKWA